MPSDQVLFSLRDFCRNQSKNFEEQNDMNADILKDSLKAREI